MSVNAQFKVTVAKLLELSIDRNRDLAISIMRSAGPFKLTVDQTGHATISSSVELLTFKGDPALSELGMSVKAISVAFEKGEGNNITYTATFKIGLASTSVYGEFNLEELILSCSGLLCIAARALKNRTSYLRDQELREIMQ